MGVDVLLLKLMSGVFFNEKFKVWTSNAIILNSRADYLTRSNKHRKKILREITNACLKHGMH